jgi:rhamnosyltransferase
MRTTTARDLTTGRPAAIPAGTPRHDCRVCAVVVIFQPDIPLLKRALAAVRPQVDGLVVVDNGCKQDVFTLLKTHLAGTQVIRLRENHGLAAAQNRAIRWASEQGYSHFLLLDQDSVAGRDMVRWLRRAFLELEQRGECVAAVGPCHVDARTGAGKHFVRFGKYGIIREDCAKRWPYVPTDFLISSGMLVSRKSFDAIGTLDETLFIDNVDLEWCFRARSNGFRLYGVCGVHMEHRLGDAVMQLWLGRWVTTYRHSPLRQYYMMRNRLTLYRRPHSPPSWVAQDCLRAAGRFLFFSLFMAPRREHFRMMLRGAWHALRGRGGRYHA